MAATTTTMPMKTTCPERGLPRMRLMHLVSSSMPVGAFAYSQGIEWAVECGWIRTDRDLEAWLASQLHVTLAHLDLPVLKRLYDAAQDNDIRSLKHWSAFLIACRETAELRAEEANRGRALARLLVALDTPGAGEWKDSLGGSQAAGFAFAAARWAIPYQDTALGYTWSWLENLVLAAVKIIPLGQTAGQRVLHELAAAVPDAVAESLKVADPAIGAATPALAIASSLHEIQYTRLFRS